MFSKMILQYNTKLVTMYIRQLNTFQDFCLQYVQEVTSPTWQHTSFLASLPLTRTTIRGQGTSEKILEHRRKAEAHPAPQRPRQTAYKARWMATCWLHCPQASTAPHKEVPPEPMVTSRHPSIVGHFIRALTLVSPQSGIAEESAGLNPWESDCDGERGRGFQQPALRS